MMGERLARHAIHEWVAETAVAGEEGADELQLLVSASVQQHTCNLVDVRLWMVHADPLCERQMASVSD